MLSALLGVLAAVAADPTPLVEVPGGVYTPLYPADPTRPDVQVDAFRIDLHPVTVGQFRAFIEENEEWRQGGPPALFADAGYLRSWTGPTTAPVPDDRPVVEVSWFAARAYCAAQGRRLPTEDEWELVGRASPTSTDGSNDPAWLAAILAWYGEPTPAVLPPVLRGGPNAWGVYDMHGLVWEWVDDFNNTLLATDAREAGDGDVLRFCGGGAASATDVRDYAAFMRIALRSSLDGQTTTRNLGFRCAADARTP